MTNSSKRIAVYAGSFDPLTNGHMWMIHEGSKLFDELIVAIGTNPDKKYTYTLNQRLEMLKLSLGNIKNVKIDSFTNQYLVKYAKKIGAQYILRGLRNSSDCTYEQGMCNINRDLDSSITTVVLMPPRDLCEISSSMIKGLIGVDGWKEIIKQYVPLSVLEKL